MALAPSEIRSRITAQVVGVLTDWTCSAGVPELFGLDNRGQMHKGYSVSIPSTLPVGGERQSARGSRSAEALCSSRVVVRWGYRLASDGQVVDYDAALDAELAIAAAIVAVDGNPRLSVVFESAQRATTPDGSHVLGTLEFSILHGYALST